MVKQPEQWHSDPRFINYNTYTKIPVVPQFTLTDNRTRAVPPEERKCLFQVSALNLYHILYRNCVFIYAITYSKMRMCATSS